MMSKSIYIYGASGHGLVVADIAKANGYKNIIFIDDGKNNYQCFDDIKEHTTIDIALGIGDNHIRAKIFKKLIQHNFNIVTLIHPSSIISTTAKIEKGTIIMPNVVINAQAKIGNACILNTSCIIEHECEIDDFVHISPNVSLAGNVKVNEFTHIGINSCSIQGISIGKNCIIGAGSTITKDIMSNKKAFGTPCKVIEDL